MNVTEEIKNRLDLVDIVGEQVQLRKSGRNYTGFCPFHTNTKTPSFYVFPETQTWRCFGACADGGDVFSFVMKNNGWEFKEALVELAKRAGVILEERRPTDKVKQAAEDRLLGLLDTAADYYHQLLLHAPQAAVARAYIDGRALNEETLAAFRVGFALESWDAARTHFNGQGYSDDDLLAAGLLTENEERNTRYDRFRNRIMIPIRNIDSRVVGFGARALDPDGVPKYLNSPQTILFDKSHLLYSLDTARKPIRAEGQVVIVEGYMDVMQAWQAGYRNVVAQMGTALTESHLRQLQKLTHRFILALDGDVAGRKSTERGFEIVRHFIVDPIVPEVTAEGKVYLESRLDVDVRILPMPEGYDPDSLIRTDPARWKNIVETAVPIVEYLIDTIKDGVDLNDPIEKSKMAEELLVLISSVPNNVQRDTYIHKLSRLLGVSDTQLLKEASRLRKLRLNKGKGRNTQSATNKLMPSHGKIAEPPPTDASRSGAMFVDLTAGSGGRRRTIMKLETNFLRECLNYPGALTAVNAILRKQKLIEVTRDDFTDPRDREIFAEVAYRATQPAVAGIDKLCDSLDGVLAERVRALISLPSPTPETQLDRLPDTLALSVLDWRLEKLRAHNLTLSNLLVQANREGSGPEPAAEYGEQVVATRLAIRHIDEARAAMSALGRRRTEEIAGGRRPR